VIYEYNKYGLGREKMTIYVAHIMETEKLIPVIKKYNLSLEVSAFGSPMALDNLDKYIEDYKKQIDEVIDYKDISFHGPFVDLIPASRDLEIRRVTKERFTKAYKAAREFKAKRIIYHTGYIPKIHWPEEWLNNSIEFWREFTKDKLDDMQIHIENVHEDDYNLMAELVDAINHKNFSVCLDIGHVNSSSTKTIEDWITGLGKRIKHVHLHNNDGSFDYHNSLLKGTINMQETLKMLKKALPEATLTLEILELDELLQSIEFLENGGFLKRI
jgi:sugar phosphate isomerase/epimerase